MPRPAEFDRDQALVSAMQLFWRQGYTATSLAALLDGMGIGRSSFYAAYGDKRSLFIETLDLFGQRTLQILRDGAGGSAEQAIRHFFNATLFDAPRRRAQRGCLMVNTVLELADVDDDLSRRATAQLKRIEAGFERLLAVEEDTALPPRQGARYLMLVNQGLRVAAREGRSRRELAESVDDALSLLGWPAAARH